MEFIPHPSYSEQLQTIETILSHVTIENVNKLLARWNLRCLTLERLQTSGRINLLFSLKTDSSSTGGRELILKVSNPHCYWKEHRTRNEIYAMQYLLEHTTIPVPQLVDYSVDAKTSILSCEFLLMEKIPGETLQSIIDKVSDQVLLRIAMQVIDYVKQMREIKVPTMDQIGSFYTREMSLNGTIEDGPTLGAFHTLKEYLLGHLQWARRRMETDDELFPLGQHLIVPMRKVIDCAQMDSYLSSEDLKFHFTHADLNSSNILVDEQTGTILAILDWERCGMTFKNDDIEFYSGWFDDYQRQIQFKSLLQQQSPQYINLIDEISDISHAKWYLDVMYSAMYATFYSCTWFEDAQGVNEHIKHFLQETEKAILAFNNYIPLEKE